MMLQTGRTNVAQEDYELLAVLVIRPAAEVVHADALSCSP